MFRRSTPRTIGPAAVSFTKVMNSFFMLFDSRLKKNIARAEFLQLETE